MKEECIMNESYVYATKHSCLRAKERLGIKNLKQFETLLNKALARGKTSIDFKRQRDIDLLSRKETEKTFIVAYSGICFVFSKGTNRCLTLFKLPTYFDKKVANYKQIKNEINYFCDEIA